MPMDISKHTRINDNIFQFIERPLIAWLVRRTPAWINSDMLTGLGVFGAVVIFFSYWLCRFHKGFLWVATLGFIIHYFGDSLDGSLARFRNRQRPHYGYFIDHTTDTFAMILVFVGIGLSPFAKLSTGLMALVGYLCLSIMVYLRTSLEGVFDISFGKVGPTEMRVVAIILNTCIFFFGNPHFQTDFLKMGRVSALDIAGYVISIILIGAFAVATVRNGIVYAKKDAERLKAEALPVKAKVKTKARKAR